MLLVVSALKMRREKKIIFLAIHCQLRLVLKKENVKAFFVVA